MSIITFLLASLVASTIVVVAIWQLAKRDMFSTFGAWIRDLLWKESGNDQEQKDTKKTRKEAKNTQEEGSVNSQEKQDSEELTPEQKRELLSAPRRSTGAWIRDLLWIVVPGSIVLGIGYLFWQAGGWMKSSVQSIEIDFSFSTGWFWAALSHPVTWVIAAIILVALFAYRMYRSGKKPEWKSVKEFVSNTMHVVLFIGASLVLFYGAIYLKNNISADSSTTRTIVATPQGTQVWVPSGCDFRYYSDHKVLVKNKHNEGGSGTNVEFGVDSANAKLTFFSTEAQSVPVKFTTVCN